MSALRFNGPDVEVSEVASVCERAWCQAKNLSPWRFRGGNYVGAARRGRFKKCFYQQVVFTQTMHRVRLAFREGCRMAEWEEFIPATGREVLGQHIGVDHEHLLGSTGRQHSKPQTRGEHRVSKKLLSIRTSSSRSHFHRSRDIQHI